MSNQKKQTDPAEGARENLNVPASRTDDATDARSGGQHPAGGRAEEPDAEERDNQAQVPRGRREGDRTTL